MGQCAIYVTSRGASVRSSKMVTKDGWERFNGEGATAFRDRLHATLGPGKIILLNANLYFAWGSPPAVFLFFNRPLKQIALIPADAKDPAAFPVKQYDRCFQIRAASFCSHYNIRLSATHKFVKPVITDDHQLILDLTNTVRVRRRRD